MYDLHCHLLPSIDDGAACLETALEMARMQVDQGVEVVACTPHILPGLFHNSGPDIVQRVEALADCLASEGIPLKLVAGADNHVTPGFVKRLQQGHLLAVGDSRYVLVETPHHVAPMRIEDGFYELLRSGYIPVLTHPERLTWIDAKYDVIMRLVKAGVWMQVTSGSLLGRFGGRAKFRAERLVCEGHAHLLASDAHDCRRRPPDLARGALAAERLIGAKEARHMVVSRPLSVLQDAAPAERRTG